MQSIKIGNKEYNISCHASCYREYSDIFKRNILKDLETVSEFNKKQLKLSVEFIKENPNLDYDIVQKKVFNETLSELDDYIECITKLCWICIYDNNPNIENYDIWYKSLERFSISDDWLTEVLALCANCFR